MLGRHASSYGRYGRAEKFAVWRLTREAGPCAPAVRGRSMRKLLLAIVALGGLAWSGTASAIVQNTDVAFENKGMPTGSGTVSLDFKTPATSSAPKRVIVHVTVRIK